MINIFLKKDNSFLQTSPEHVVNNNNNNNLATYSDSSDTSDSEDEDDESESSGKCYEHSFSRIFRNSSVTPQTQEIRKTRANPQLKMSGGLIVFGDFSGFLRDTIDYENEESKSSAKLRIFLFVFADFLRFLHDT